MLYLRVALSFLTILPVSPKQLPEKLGSALPFFPAVGLLLGAALWGLDAGLREIFPVGVSSAGVILFLAIATRGLHLDGFLDSCDALFGAHTREERLATLKDPHVGSFAVIGGIMLILIQWASLNALSVGMRPEILLLLPCLSRYGMMVAVDRYPYARKEGLGTAFRGGKNAGFLLLAAGSVLAVSALIGGWAGVTVFIVALGVGLLVGKWMTLFLGGLTGDSYGAINEVAVVCVLLTAVALVNEAPQWFDAVLSIG